MRRRKKQTVIQGLLILLLLCGWVSARFNMVFSPLVAMQSGEKLNHYGPSQEILLEYKKDGVVHMVGKVDDRTLSVYEAHRDFGFFWYGYPSGPCAIKEGEHVWARYQETLLGLTDLKEAETVVCILQTNKTELEAGQPRIYEMSVDEQGFFYVPYEDCPNLRDWYINQIQIFDANGILLDEIIDYEVEPR